MVLHHFSIRTWLHALHVSELTPWTYVLSIHATMVEGYPNYDMVSLERVENTPEIRRPQWSISRLLCF